MNSYVVLLASFAANAAIAQTAPVAVQNAKSKIRTWEFGTGQRPMMMLHGYGSSPQDWFQFVRTIQVSKDTRFVFPEAPEETRPPDGPAGGRAWWQLDLASHQRKHDAIPDLTKTQPPGLVRAVASVRALMGEVQGRLRAAPGQMVLGGFSQGAIVSAGIAFGSDDPLRALVLLSGTIVDERNWMKAMARRRGLPVFIAHGRRDQMLPFDVAERLAGSMRKAGLKVTWVPFDGGHEAPAEVVTALNVFLAGLGK